MLQDAMFRLLFERSADAILLLDTSRGAFVAYNQAALEMLRCSQDELAELHPSELSPPTQPDGRPSREKANELIARAVQEGSQRFEWVHRSPHREDFPVEVVLTPIQLGDTPMLMVVWRDITERKRGEAALRQAQKLESLGILAGGIAHDFNNLLQVILGRVEMARATLDEGNPAERHLGFAEAATLKAANLTQQMLAYTGKGVLSVHPFDLTHAVQEMADLLEAAVPKGIRTLKELASGLPAILGDRAQVQQVILNLITNAAEAIGTGEGTITLRTRPSRIDGIDFVTLEVQDTGQGISPEHQARIFDPFFTTKAAGRGLGLAVLQGIVQGHKGLIEIESRPGTGTSFRIHFPASAERAVLVPPPARASLASAAAPSGTVLLVDDETNVRTTAGALLEHLGFEVLEASGGAEALATFDAQRARIGWVLMDLTMPGMDGFEAFLALRQRDPAARIVVCTGWTDRDLAGRFGDVRPTAVLTKPFRAEELEKILRQAGILAG